MTEDDRPTPPTEPPLAPSLVSQVRDHEAERTLQRYERLERLGAGGMAIVWRAMDHKLHREVALKELRDEVALAPEGLARFKHEAEAIARLSHPNVVGFFDAVEDGTRTFLVMELVRGETFSRLLEGRPPLRRAIELVEKVARGVHHAHEQGVVHRDLKPSNVLVAADTGEPKVSDFGLAHLSGELVTTLTRTGALLGTPAYMAPEQARGDRAAIGVRTDVYALGAILYEVLAGRPPFRSDSIHALVHEVVNNEPPEPRKLDPKVPIDLQTIALKCLAKEPDRRYATAREVERELRRWLEHEPILARPPSPTQRVALWVRRNQRSATLLGLLATAVAVVGLGVGARIYERWQRSQVVATELARVEAGNGDDGSMDRVLAVADDRTRAVLVRRLAAATEELAGIARAVYLSAKDPEPDEARAGQERIEGLEATVATYLATGRALGKDDDVLALAARRLEDRATRRTVRNVQAPEPDFRLIVASEQERRASPGTLRAGSFASELLGRIGGESAVAPLASYLMVIHSEVGATPVGEALARIGGDEAEDALYVARVRHGGSTLFWQRVQPLLAAAPKRPDRVARTSQELADRAVRKTQRGDVDGAIADLTSAVALDPRNAVAWFNLGSSHLERGEREAALAEFTKACELRPTDAGFLMMRGAANRALGNVDEALDDFSRSLELDPSRPTTWMSRGNLKRQTGDPRGAIADLTSAIALERRNPAAWMNRGLSKRTAKDVAGALADYAEALSLDPKNVATLINRGSLLVDRNELGAAIDDLTRAIGIAPGAVDAYLNRGLAFTKRGDPDSAIADLTKAIELAPKNPTGWWLRGRAWKDKGDLPPAIKDLAEAVELAPRNVNMRVDLGSMRRLVDDNDGAIADLSKALELDPKSWLAWTNRATAKAAKNDWKGAIADQTRAIEIAPRRPDAYQGRARARMATKDVKGALADVNRAIELAPSDAFGYYLRAGIHAELKESADAIVDYTRAIELSPRWVEAHSQRAAVRVAEQDFAGAIADATRALELGPRCTQALAARGAARFKTGDRAGSKADLERYLELSPEGPDAAACKELLEALAEGEKK